MDIFLQKKVCIKAKNGFIYRGIVENVGDELITINDMVDGILMLAVSEILTISEYNEHKIKRSY